MAIREIVLLGSEVLRTPGDEVTSFEADLRDLVEDMFETMYHAEGIGLAAPQIGISKRIFVVDAPDQDEHPGGRLALINPKLIAASRETTRAAEGCLSIPGMEEVVERPATIEMRGFDVAGEEVAITASGLFGRALQHELDHIDGVLFIDRIGTMARQLLLKKWRKSQEQGP